VQRYRITVTVTDEHSRTVATKYLSLPAPEMLETLNELSDTLQRAHWRHVKRKQTNDSATIGSVQSTENKEPTHEQP